jgi:uncharacterized protein
MTNQTVVPGGDITSDDKLWALLSYLTSGFLGIIILLMEDKKSRPFLKFHGVQSLATGIVLSILVSILSAVTVGFGACILVPAMIGYFIYLGVKAYKGEYVNVPFITDFCKKQGWIA